MSGDGRRARRPLPGSAFAPAGSSHGGGNTRGNGPRPPPALRIDDAGPHKFHALPHVGAVRACCVDPTELGMGFSDEPRRGHRRHADAVPQDLRNDSGRKPNPQTHAVDLLIRASHVSERRRLMNYST